MIELPLTGHRQWVKFDNNYDPGLKETIATDEELSMVWENLFYTNTTTIHHAINDFNASVVVTTGEPIRIRGVAFLGKRIYVSLRFETDADAVQWKLTHG